VTGDVLLADAPSAWRSAVAEGLRAAGRSILVVDDGANVLSALTDAAHRPAVVIVGQELRGLSGVDALFLAREAQTSLEPRGRVFLVTDVHHDVQFLELLRARGVHDFLHRDEPAGQAVERVLSDLGPDRRLGERDSVRLDAVVLFKNKEIRGSLYDLSLTGAQLVIPANALEPSQVSIGTVLHLRFGFRDEQLEGSAEVRRLSMQNSLFGDGLVFGVRFTALDEAQRAKLERVLAGASEELEMARRG
jgi:hypothetical protein